MSARQIFASAIFGTLVVVMILHTAARGDEATALPSAVVSYPRGGPERTGAFPKLRLPERPKSGWKVDMGRYGGAPVIAGDRLIAGYKNNALIALSMKDDTVLWNSAAPGFRVYVAPVVVGDRVYCASERGMSAHALEDGTVIWQRDVPGGVGGSSPLVVGAAVVAGGDDGFVYAWKTEDGRELWKTDIVKDKPDDPPGLDGARARVGNNKARCETAASDGTHVFISIFDQCRVVALDLKTGATRWSHATKGWIGAGPTVAGGKVVLGSQDGKIYALDAATGKFLWSFTTRLRADGDLAYCDGSIFAAASDGRCYRIDATDGHKVWEYETELNPEKTHYFLSGAPLVDASAVYFGSWDGYLYALNRADGTLKWRHQPAEHHEHVLALITDGRRIFASLYPRYDFKAQRDLPGMHGVVAIDEAKP